jgi:hypothetical protein
MEAPAEMRPSDLPARQNQYSPNWRDLREWIAQADEHSKCLNCDIARAREDVG